MRIAGLFNVRPRVRRDGKVAWIAMGTVAGKQIQFERVDRVEAEKIAAEHNAKIMAAQKVEQPILTKLTPNQVSDAEKAFALLPPAGSVYEAAQFFTQHFRPVAAIPWEVALMRYIEFLRSECKVKEITSDVAYYVLHAFGKRKFVSSTLDVTEDEAREWILDPKVSIRTQRDRYDQINRMCSWLVKDKALLKNPIPEIRRPKVTSEPPTIFTPAQVKKLLECARDDEQGPEMLPFFAVCALSGVRPFEMRRAEDGHFFLDDGKCVFEVWRSKTPWRTVELTEQLVSILRACRNRGLNLAFFSKRKFDRIRRAAGVFESWDNDILRHTYASYHYARNHSIKTLERNLGTSERILFRHYIRRTVRRSEANGFFEISVPLRSVTSRTETSVRP
jgi:integrase